MNENMYESMYEIEKNHWWFRAKRNIVSSIINSSSLIGSLKIVDFGCGTGIMLETLSEFGEVTGIDFSQKALDFCRNRGSFRLMQADLSEVLPLDTEYDIGIAMDVLEHLEDDLTALKNMEIGLKHGGKLIITVPAFMFLWSSHDENCAHKRRYCLKELETLIKNAGLEIEHLSYYNFWLFPVIVLLRLFFKIFRIDSNSEMENKQNNKLVNAILYRIFKSEGFFIRNGIKLPFGVSLIAILKRN